MEIEHGKIWKNSKVVVGFRHCTACGRTHREVTIAKGENTVYEFATARSRTRHFVLADSVEGFAVQEQLDQNEGRVLIVVRKGELNLQTVPREKAYLTPNCVLSQESGGYKMSYVVLAAEDVEYQKANEVHQDFVHQSCIAGDEPKILREAFAQESLPAHEYLALNIDIMGKSRQGFLARVWRKFLQKNGVEGYCRIVSELDAEVLVDDSQSEYYGGVNSGGNVGKRTTIKITPIDLAAIGVAKATLVTRKEHWFNQSSFRHNYDEKSDQIENYLVIGVSPEDLKVQKVKISEDTRVLAALEAAGISSDREDFSELGFEVKGYEEGVETSKDFTSYYGGPNSGGSRGWRHEVLANTPDTVVVEERWINNSTFEDRPYPIFNKIVVYLKTPVAV